MTEPAQGGGEAAAAVLASLLPAGLVGCLARIEELQAPLATVEQAGTERMAPGRLREYTAGRTAARQALRQLTGEACVVPRNPDRSPRWPAGVCGSLSHSSRYAICVAGPTKRFHAIGVDIEEEARVEATLWEQTLTMAERKRLSSLPDLRPEELATLLFSAKEAYFKCLSPERQACAEAADPRHTETAVDFERRSVTCLGAENTSAVQGRFARYDGHWLTLFAIAGPGAPDGGATGGDRRSY